MKPRLIPGFVLPSLASLVVACASYQGGLTGHVTEQRSHAAVRDAVLTFTEVGGSGRHTLTAGYGGAFSTTLPEGIYSVSAKHPTLVPCATISEPVKIVRGQVVQTRICLQAADVAAGQPPAASGPVAQPLEPGQEPLVVSAPVASPDITFDSKNHPPASQFPPSPAPTFPPVPRLQ